MDLREIARPPDSPLTSEHLDRAETLGEALQALVESHPGFRCLTLLDRRRNERQVSLADLWSRARDVQAAMLERGLRPGAAVVLILPTGPELVSAYFGALLAGGIPAMAATPSNRVADPRVYTHLVGAILENSGADLLYCEGAVAALFEGEASEFLRGTRILRSADVAACAHPPEIARPGVGDIATLQYSSGSTGAPKGVLLTHRAMLNNIRSMRDGLGLTPQTVSVNWIPLYHDMGLMGGFLLPLLCGCPAVLIPTMDFMREPALWLWAIHRYRGVLSWAPNFAYNLCAKRVPEAELDGLDLSCWQTAINAAEPVLADTISRFASRFAKYGFAAGAMRPAWGLAENVTMVTAHPQGHEPRVEVIDRERLASENRAVMTDGPGLASVAIGRCLPRCQIEIRDTDGRALPDRSVGDMWIRSDSLFEGYRDAPELTARVRVGGWLNTGDRGYVADGDLFFLYRDKDLIVIGGDKFAPHDIEAAINRVPGVREGCVVAFGVLSEGRGTEELAAVVETRHQGGEERDALTQAIREEVLRTTGLGLRHLELVPPGSVQKTTSGKLARAATRQRYFGDVGDGRR